MQSKQRKCSEPSTSSSVIPPDEEVGKFQRSPMPPAMRTPFPQASHG